VDDSRFDAIAKAFGSLASRRLTLGVLLGGTLGRLGLAETEAKGNSGKCKPACTQCNTCDKGKCHKNKHGKKVCKKGKCKPQSGTLCTVASGAGGSCQNGTCVITCTGDTTNCGGTCRNLQTDNAHCGACNTPCAAGLTCCSGVCRNLQTDPANCGVCGTVVGGGGGGGICTANQVCQAGSCFPRSTCPANLTSVCSFSATGTPCGTTCQCGRSAEGNVVCIQNESFCTTPRPCTTSANCAAGQACVDVAGCCTPALPAGTKNCGVRCSTPTAASVPTAEGGGGRSLE